jgi:hypothetical protein
MVSSAPPSQALLPLPRRKKRRNPVRPFLYLSLPASPTLTSPPTALTTPANPPVRLVDIPGKGKGLVAARSFAPGELIFSEKPILRCESSAQALYDTLPGLIASLSPPQRAAFRRLTIAPNQRALWGDTDQARHTTNAMQFEQDLNEYGIPLLATRFNHSCRSTVCRAFDENKGVVRFFATRRIDAGEELTMAYVNDCFPTSQRSEHLREHFGFICQCEVCSLVGQEAVDTDARRSRVKAIIDYLSTNDEAADPIKEIELVKTARSLMQTEGLSADRTVLPRTAARLSVMWGDVVHAKEWYRLALKCQAMETGKESTEYAALLTESKDPCSLNIWRCRGRRMLVGPE